MEQKKKKYTPGQSVVQSQQKYEQHSTTKPGAYQSQNKPQIDSMRDQLMNRPAFKFDANNNALYKQLTEDYIRNGQMAMMDTIGQASSLTGGYNNSYAQNAGQQAYHGWLQKINERLPDIYNMELQGYMAEGDALRQNLGMLQDQENIDYGRYEDTLNRWQSENDRLYDQAQAEADRDYDRFQNDLADDRRREEFEYGKGQDALVQDRWQAEFDEDKRRHDQAWAEAHPGKPAGGGGGGGGYYAPGKQDTETEDGISEEVQPIGGDDLVMLMEQYSTGLVPADQWGKLAAKFGEDRLYRTGFHPDGNAPVANNAQNPIDNDSDANGVWVGGKYVGWGELEQMVESGKVKEIRDPKTGNYTYKYVGNGKKPGKGNDRHNMDRWWQQNDTMR